MTNQNQALDHVIQVYIMKNFYCLPSFHVLTSRRMDTVVEDGDFLADFINSCNRGEDSDEREEEGVSSSSVTPLGNEGEENKEPDVWMDIEEALNSWTRRIFDLETRYSKTVSFRQDIEESLRRQQQDGFLNHQDIVELSYIADLWTKLLNSVSSYTIGCEFVKRDIITFLLELYKLRQITDRLFIEACLQL